MSVLEWRYIQGYDVWVFGRLEDQGKFVIGVTVWRGDMGLWHWQSPLGSGSDWSREEVMVTAELFAVLPPADDDLLLSDLLENV